MKRLLPPCALLLVALLFPGFPRAQHANHEATGGPSAPKEESHGPETHRSHGLRHREKRYYLPRTPPYKDPEPYFNVVNCKRNEGRCQEYCNYMEVQIGYCIKTKDACCLPQN
ncbi:sperm-associated antigen 11B-like [Saccopteryx leptura]|uniref:sperm-associated antigen 11B-like n=1 Tax=Saccopteryx leptura TaxID=249018 RepID=UPI00339D0B1C